MKLYEQVKPWMIAAVLAVFVSACATTQEEIIEDDGTSTGSDSTSTGIISDDDTSGADATGLSDDDSTMGTAIGDESSMTALERLEQTEGELANRTIYFRVRQRQANQRVDRKFWRSMVISLPAMAKYRCGSKGMPMSVVPESTILHLAIVEPSQ